MADQSKVESVASRFLASQQAIIRELTALRVLTSEINKGEIDWTKYNCRITQVSVPPGVTTQVLGLDTRRDWVMFCGNNGWENLWPIRTGITFGVPVPIGGNLLFTRHRDGPIPYGPWFVFTTGVNGETIIELLRT